MVSKPILEWFEELPEPYRSQAIENTKKHYEKQHLDLLKEKSLIDAIQGGFDWGRTIQGGKYWVNVHDAIIDNKIHSLLVDFKSLYFGLIEECFDKDPAFLHPDNYDAYISACGVYSGKIQDYLKTKS